MYFIKNIHNVRPTNIKTSALSNISKQNKLTRKRYCNSTNIKFNENGILVRDFIAECLYKRTESYFTNSAPVHSLSEPLNFREMSGLTDYKNTLYEIFEDIDGFMTPVEIFKPYYAEALAKYMVSVIQAKGQYEYFHPNNPFRIVEVGGGNGTCAKGILDYIQKHHESLYENTQYEIIDVSKSFHEKQKELLQVHSKRVKLVNESIFDYKGKDDSEGFFVGLEILDNLPHDKIIISNEGIIHEVRVFPKPEEPIINPFSGEEVAVGPYIEKRYALSDPLILELLQLVNESYGFDSNFFSNPPNDNIELAQCHLLLWHALRFPKLSSYKASDSSSRIEKVKEYLNISNFNELLGVQFWKNEFSYLGALSGGVPQDRIFYLPTMSYQLLKIIKSRFPKKEILFNDFDALPGAMYGHNAPLVQRTEGNVTTSYLSYLDSNIGYCDIFFPTNFEFLALMHKQLFNRQDDNIAQVMKSKVFMNKWADVNSTRTKFFYNPLLHDFLNTKFFITAKI